MISKINDELLKQLEQVQQADPQQEIPVIVTITLGADPTALEQKGLNIKHTIESISAVSGPRLLKSAIILALSISETARTLSHLAGSSTVPPLLPAAATNKAPLFQAALQHCFQCLGRPAASQTHAQNLYAFLVDAPIDPGSEPTPIAATSSAECFDRVEISRRGDPNDTGAVNGCRANPRVVSAVTVVVARTAFVGNETNPCCPYRAQIFCLPVVQADSLYYAIPTVRLALSRVLRSSIAMVIGPTPPGTGVMADATSLTSSKATSPTSR